jgi:tetraacyldisaccharide 4'-kinase
MKYFDRVADRVRRGERLSPPLSVLLHGATVAQRWGMRHRLHGPKTRVAARVVSFGNLTAGGTGKTPAVIARAKSEIAAGARVGILTRGYGAASGKAPVIVAPDDSLRDLVDRIGDEGALMLRSVPEVYLVKCADRVQGARTAIEEFGCEVLLLDDGFQAVALERDENILLVDATNPFGNGYLVPRGILREKKSAAARATEIIMTRCDQVASTAALEEELATWAPGIPIQKTKHAPAVLWRVDDGTTLPLDTLRGATVTAVCGVGHPESFWETLTSLGAEIDSRVAHRDHATIDPASLPREGLVVVTEKDAVRMGSSGSNILALGIELREFVSSTDSEG